MHFTSSSSLASTLLLSSLTSTALARVVSSRSGNYYPPGAVCNEYVIPVNPSATGYVFNQNLEWKDNFGVATFVTSQTIRDPHAPAPFTGMSNITGQYTIAASFCTPSNANAAHAKTVLLATHGIGFDRSYWNIAYEPEKYNFVQYAINQGYSVFFYDRLGVGNSSRESGYVNQLSIQVSILQQLTNYVKAGKYTGTVGVPKSTVLVGHSFGSTISHGVVYANTSAADAVILTGYQPDASFINAQLILSAWEPRVANLQNNPAWGTHDLGYLTWVDLYANVDTFLSAPAYETGAAQYSEAHKSPFAITELFTSGPGGFTNTTYSDPVLFIAGVNDFIVCAGYCTDLLEPAAVKKFFTSNSGKVQTYVQPSMGHGINFQLNATGAYGVVTNFLASNGF